MSKIDIMDGVRPSDANRRADATRYENPTFDIEKYRAELADLGLTEDQERELLETLAPILWHFVRLGWEVDICGQILDAFNEASDDESGDGKLGASPTAEPPSDDKQAEN